MRRGGRSLSAAARAVSTGLQVYRFLVTGRSIEECRARDQWTGDEARRWYAAQPWLVGCNFIPSNAVNQLEMWQAETFEIETIDCELGWAADIGFYTVRVFLHDLLWQQDAEGLLGRVDRFLEVAEGHAIRPMFVLFDGVWDAQPRLGRQRASRPRVQGGLGATGGSSRAGRRRSSHGTRGRSRMNWSRTFGSSMCCASMARHTAKRRSR